ncbi:piggyBac transposable element-derived protein 3-like [Phymastichus coffea]|uniref:piggyBac transposable element-derived protein 3-like n=1 Tax=Phymastichus coffea TaxID=108790 RepID=UPI00273C6B50|nr:piggyBac transposable element-derived protein 3-like [Phymastichus coffea]
MPPKKRSKNSDQQYDIETEENDENFDVIMIPSLDDSQDSESDSNSENENDHIDVCSFLENLIPTTLYNQVLDSYSENQKKLEPNHVYKWLDGEKVYGEKLTSEVFLSESDPLSIDECMIKFYGRTVLKQFMKGKPVRFGMKLWAICNKEGFIFDFDIYCGKGSNHLPSKQLENLRNCALGSRVVLQMLQRLLTTVSLRKISRYHIYFDNFFSSPDLFVHLRKIGLRATGTVRANRVSGVTIDLNNKSKRGTYFVKHDKNSGVNYISVMDSKIVSLLSTAAGITPLSSAKRYSKDEHGKVEIPCPYAFNLYNNFMGGVDQHDYYCSSLLPCIRSKKWTWVVLMRIIQGSITNAAVLKNLVCEHNARTYPQQHKRQDVPSTQPNYGPTHQLRPMNPNQPQFKLAP